MTNFTRVSMKCKEWNFLSPVLKLLVETLNMISCTHQCLAETLLCCWERLDELSLIFIWTEVERLDCSSAVALTNFQFHFCSDVAALLCFQCCSSYCSCLWGFVSSFWFTGSLWNTTEQRWDCKKPAGGFYCFTLLSDAKVKKCLLAGVGWFESSTCFIRSWWL